MIQKKAGGELTYREIYGQPQSFAAVCESLPEIERTLGEVFAEEYEELIFTGCGTSLYLAQAAAYVFGFYNRIPAKAVCCSELYYTPATYIKGKTLVLPITRKSYTTEVRMAIDRVRKLPGVKTLAITCDGDSREYNDYFVLSPNTAEESVIMTRSFTSMVLLAEIISLYAAGKLQEQKGLRDIPQMAEAILPQMDALAQKITEENPGLNLYVTLGQGIYYGIANECMNKLKEMGLTNSEAYYTLEYRHGPMSLVDKNTLILLIGDEQTAREDATLIEEMESYGALTVSLGVNPDLTGGKYRLAVGRDALTAAPMVGMFAQLLGYYIAQKKGLDADSPRHLSQAIILK